MDRAEMVNPESDLYRAHPDWILSTGQRVPPPQRYQLVLDLTRPEASGYLFDQISSLLSEYPICYVKWDCNRDLIDAGSAHLGIEWDITGASPDELSAPPNGTRNPYWDSEAGSAIPWNR